MKQKELIYAIKEGLNQSRNDFMKDLLRGILYGIGIFLILGAVWWSFHELRYRSEPLQTAMPKESECKGTGFIAIDKIPSIQLEDIIIAYNFFENEVSGEDLTKWKKENPETLEYIRNRLNENPDGFLKFEERKYE